MSRKTIDQYGRNHRANPGGAEDCLFPSRLHRSDPLFFRQYPRFVKALVALIGLDPAMYGTNMLQRTKT